MKKVLLFLLAGFMVFSLTGCGEDYDSELEKIKSKYERIEKENEEENKGVEQVICVSSSVDKYGTHVTATSYYVLNKKGIVSSTNVIGEYVVDRNKYNSWSDKKKSMNDYATETMGNLEKTMFTDNNIGKQYYKIEPTIEENKLTVSVLFYNSLTSSSATKQEVLDTNKDATCRVETINN